MKNKWHIQTKAIADLIPHPKNPRQFTEKGMKDLGRSIDAFGLAEPIVVNSDDTIIGGHARVMVLKQRGETECECYVPDRQLTEKEVEQLMIRLNANQAGVWDTERLANEWELPELLDWGLDLPEFRNLETQEDDYEVPADIVTDIKRGDLFEIGQHRLLCGDSTKAEDVAKLLDGSCMGALVTDPPYNVGVKYTEDTDDNKSKEDYILWSKKWAEFCPNKKILTVGCQRLVWWDSILGDPQWIIAWIKKNGQGNTNLLGTNKWDAILLYSVPQDRNIDIIEINNDYSGKIKNQDKHPTAKPVKLYAELIKRFTSENELIYEPFSGTGTTMLAAHQFNRRCFGMEISPQYCQVIIDRMKKAFPDIEIKQIN